jgi:ubiquitin C-terminal hydrolase
MQVNFGLLCSNLYSFVRNFNFQSSSPPALPAEVDKKIEQSALPVIQAEAAPGPAVPEIKEKQIQVNPPIDAALKNAVQVHASGKSKAVEVIDLSCISDEIESSPSPVRGKARGITNIGNSCYMNASLQALGQCQGIAEILNTKLTAEHNPNAAKINSFRDRVLAFLQELQKKEKAIPKGNASGFMDFLMSCGWSLKIKKKNAHDAYPFVEFMMNSLQLEHKIYGVTVENDSAPIQFGTLLFPALLSEKRKKALFLSKDEKRDFFVVALEARFLDSQGGKNMRKVQPSHTLDLPYCDNESKKERYKLAAIIVNPSQFARSGHYVTYAPQGDKWVEYNDSEVLVHDALDQEALSAIEQHSYLCFYTRVGASL